MTTALQTMAFNNEVVSDADIDRYNLPFQKGGLRWWTRDAERDYYLWGGLSGNPAFDDVLEGWFYLYVDGFTYTFFLKPGKFSNSLKDIPYIVVWDCILRIIPEVDSSENYRRLVLLLKEALTKYGLYGEKTKWPVKTKVIFNF